MDARKRAYGSCGLLDSRFRGNERSYDGQTQESQRSRFARIVVEVRIGRADAVDLLLLPGSQRLARVEAPDAFQQALAAQDFVTASDHPMEVVGGVEDRRVAVGHLGVERQEFSGYLVLGDRRVDALQELDRPLDPHAPMAEQP